MLSLMLGIAIGTVFGAGGLLTFSMAAIAADSERMMPAVKSTPGRPGLADIYEVNENIIRLQTSENRL